MPCYVDTFCVNGIGFLDHLQQALEEGDLVGAVFGGIALCVPMRRSGNIPHGARATHQRVVKGIRVGEYHQTAAFLRHLCPAAVLREEFRGAGEAVDRNDQRILGFHAPLIGGGLIGVPEALQAVHRNVRALHVRVGVHVLGAAQVGVALAAPALVVLRKGDHLFDQNVPAENRRVLFLAEPNLTASRVVQAAFANAPLLAEHPRKAVEKIFLPHPRRFLEIPPSVGGLSDQERGHGNFAAGQIGIAV